MRDQQQTPDGPSAYELVYSIRDQLIPVAGGDAAREADLIVQEATGFQKLELIVHGMKPVTAQACQLANAMVANRLTGMPVHRVVGNWHGWLLDEHTLQPRDDTETLIEAVFDRYDDTAQVTRFADLGTGTGFVGLSLLEDFREAECVATDISAEALKVAKRNAEQFCEERFFPVLGSWLEPLTGTFDFIVSNPPYIATDIISTLEPSVRDYDPHLALDGGQDGLDAYRSILSGAKRFLRPEGFVALEIGYDQADPVASIARDSGWGSTIVHRDLSGHDRVIIAN